MASFKNQLVPTQALSLDAHNKKLNAVLYSNRALAYMKLKKFDLALKDCNLSIEQDE